MANSNVSVVMAGIRGGCVMPAAVYKGTLGLNVYFTDLSGAYQSWSGDATYTVSLKVARVAGFVMDLGIVNNLQSVGTVDIGDGTTTRTMTVSTKWDSTNIVGADGLLGGYNGAGAGSAWIFNGGTGGAGVSAAAVWAGTRVTQFGQKQTTNLGGAVILQADSVGARGALVFSSNSLWPAVTLQSDRLATGSASVRERILLRAVPPDIVSTTSFTPITNGWSVSIPFTDEQFLEWSEATTPPQAISPFVDFPCEIVVADNGGNLIGLVTSKFRVYRKQIHLAL